MSILDNCNIEQRRVFLTSKCLSIYNYFAPLVCAQNLEIKQAFVTCVMKVARKIFKQQTRYMTNNRVCTLAGIDTPENMISKGCTYFMHRVIDTEKPKSIHSLIHWPKNVRLSQNLTLNQPLNTARTSRYLVNCSLQHYNEMTVTQRALTHKQLKKVMNKNLVKQKKKLKRCPNRYTY